MIDDPARFLQNFTQEKAQKDVTFRLKNSNQIKKTKINKC